MNNKNIWLLGVFFIIAFIDGIIVQYFEPNDDFPRSGIFFTLVYATIFFIWYYYDSEKIQYKRGVFLNVGIIGLAILALPYYFFRSRGFKQGLLYTVTFIVILTVWVAIQVAGTFVVTYAM